MARLRGPKSVTVGLDLHVLQISGTWEPNDDERKAAWELHVQYSFGVLAVAMLNYGLRPVLARWHPALEDWEAARPSGHSRGEHERAWDHAQEFRVALDAARDVLTQYARLMADACGVPDLLTEAAPH
jgi:hypothetical protein